MKKCRGIVFIIILIIIVASGCFILNETYSITLTDNFIENNINKLNAILEKNYNYADSIFRITDKNGNVPAYQYYNDINSRSIKALKAYDNKIFLGLGDWDNNTGPTKMLYYNTLTRSIETSGTINDEAVESFEIINNSLYTVGRDPRDAWGYGSYYLYNNEANTWEKHMFKGGWIHVFDIMNYNNKIFMSGSVKSSFNRSLIQVSSDNGNTFEDTKIVFSDGKDFLYDDSFRAYSLFTYKNSLYAHINNSTKYSGIYKYDEENNQFYFIQSDIPLTYPFKNSTGKVVNSLPVYEKKLFFKTLNFNNEYIYISGHYLYSLNDLQDEKIGFDIIDVGDNYAIQNGVIHDNTLYLLSYFYNNDNSFDVRIYKTNDLKNYDIIYEFKTNSFPYSIEYFNNKIYIGTSLVSNVKDTSSVGSLYEIDLDLLNINLSLKDDNTIHINTGSLQYDTSYNFDSLHTSFKTILSFNDNMSKEELNLEFDKIKNMYLLYAISYNRDDVYYESSVSYFNDFFRNYFEHFYECESAKSFYDSISNLNIETKKISILSENINNDDGNYNILITFNVNNIDDSITSDKYIIDRINNYIYIGNETNIDTIKDNITTKSNISLNVDFDSNKLFLNLEDETISEYLIVRIETDMNIINKCIFTGKLTVDNILSKINVINANALIENNKLKIEFNNSILYEYDLIRVSSSDLNILSDDKIYISNKNENSLDNSLNITNCEYNIYNGKLKILNNNDFIKEIDLLSINFGNLTVNNKTIVIPDKLTYSDFIKNIVVSNNIIFKIVDNYLNVVNDSMLNSKYLKVYYDDIEIDSFELINEYLFFHDSIKIDTENDFLYNIGDNRNVSYITKKIDTTGKIVFMNNKDELINDNDLIGTGSRININLTNDKYDYLIIVNGDVDGDGLLSSNDINSIANYLYHDKNDLKNIYLKAADYDNNNDCNLEDIMKIAYKIKYNNSNLGVNLANKILDTYNQSDEYVEKNVGNVIYKIDIKNNLISDIDGNVRYFGSNPNNYIYFNCDEYPDNNCELWRIVGVFDNKVKLIRNSSLGNLSYDFDYNNDLTSYTFDNNWHTSSINNLLNNSYLNNIDTVYYNYNYKTSTISEVSLNFNTENFGIKDNTLSLITNSKYNVGGWYYTNDVYADDIYNYEKGFEVYDKLYDSVWYGKVALPNTSDFMYSADFTKCNLPFFKYGDSVCATENWMRSIVSGDYSGWTINYVSAIDIVSYVFYQNTGGFVNSLVTSSFQIIPVLFLDKDINIITLGDGSENNPYKLLLN